HEGSMTQVGINTGPCHCRQLGLAKSYQAKLSEEECTAHDEDINGAAGIFWSLILSMMPTEITGPAVRELHENKIPHLATRFVEPGKGFKLTLGNKAVIFSEASRAPPEVYLTKGYSA
ncbi:hypothetical protein BDP27DRAFT_1235445, partial [Rhodocollybia butyracea]